MSNDREVFFALTLLLMMKGLAACIYAAQTEFTDLLFQLYNNRINIAVCKATRCTCNLACIYRIMFGCCFSHIPPKGEGELAREAFSGAMARAAALAVYLSYKGSLSVSPRKYTYIHVLHDI